MSLVDAQPPGGAGGSFEADYEALRSGSAAFARPRDVVGVRGPDAVSYLQGQCSQDLEVLEVGGQADSLLLAPDGKVVALVRVTRTGEEELLLDVDEGFGAAVLERLSRFKLRTKVDLELLAWDCVAVLGPAADGARQAVPATEPAPLWLPWEWNGWRGADVLYPRQAEQWQPAGFRLASAAAWEACRVESGVPLMGRELDERTIPAEVPGLVERAVSFTKGCYTGQELVARLDARGSRVPRHLRSLVVGATRLRPGQLVGAELLGPGGRDVGRITSAAWSPAVAGIAALGYVHRSVAVGELVQAAAATGGETATAECEVREIPLT